METTCTYCQLDTAGNHNWNCPVKDVNPIVSTNTTSPMTKEELTAKRLAKKHYPINIVHNEAGILKQEFKRQAFCKGYVECYVNQAKQRRKDLPSDKEVGEWFVYNIDNDSASSAIYKFRVWLKERLSEQQGESQLKPQGELINVKDRARELNKERKINPLKQ